MKKRDWIISIVAGVFLGLFVVVLGATKSNVIPNMVKAEDSANSVVGLMLKSHTTWQTLKGTATVEWINAKEDNKEIFTQSIELANPDKAKLVVYDNTGKNILTWAANGTIIDEVDESTKIMQEYSQQDFSKALELVPLESDMVDKESIVRHPMAMILPSSAADYIYSTGLAQRDGTYELIGEEQMIDRRVWILDFSKQNDQNEITMKARYWVDQDTGVILKANVFSTDPATYGALIESVSFTNIEFDIHIQESDFTLSQAGLIKATVDPNLIQP